MRQAIYIFINKIAIVFSGVIILIFPFQLFSAEIFVSGDHENIKQGEIFSISVLINAQEALNAVEGKLLFPADLLRIEAIHDGNSIINFWIEKPHLESEGVISFSGVTPGGFTGTITKGLTVKDKIIFSVVFQAQKEGSGKFLFSDTKVLANDGLGTQVVLVNRYKNFFVKGYLNEHNDFQKDTVAVFDIDSPEIFSPEISRNEHVFSGQWFLSFSTVDKHSGISHYEVQEVPFKFLKLFKEWKKVESPYILENQNRKSFLFIKAVDNAGNERIIEIAPLYKNLWYVFILWTILIIATLFTLYRVVKTVKTWKGRNM
jgi:hypothetical protein